MIFKKQYCKKKFNSSFKIQLLKSTKTYIKTNLVKIKQILLSFKITKKTKHSWNLCKNLITQKEFILI